MKSCRWNAIYLWHSQHFWSLVRVRKIAVICPLGKVPECRFLHSCSSPHSWYFVERIGIFPWRVDRYRSYLLPNHAPANHTKPPKHTNNGENAKFIKSLPLAAASWTPPSAPSCRASSRSGRTRHQPLQPRPLRRHRGSSSCFCSRVMWYLRWYLGNLMYLNSKVIIG